MVAARKSPVSAKNSPRTSRKRRSSSLETISKLISEPTVPAKKPGNYPTSSTFIPQGKESSKQPTANNNINGSSNSQVHKMSVAGVEPLWLLRLQIVNRYSSGVAFVFVAITLVVYGWTVYSQQVWSQAYRKLQNLQRHERQLITTNATLTSKMAEEAETPTAGLVSPTPEGTIFLHEASSNPNDPSSTKIPDSGSVPFGEQQTPSPIGY